jgi:ABC-type uncharacterized transport system ATPase subunit
MTPRLALEGISKQYPSVKANDRIDLTVKPGEIHAILGENGAGKSTLMKIIYGAVQPDEGRMLWDGRPVSVRSPHEARALGISMVFQHFSLFDTLTAAENVWLGLDKPMRLAEVTQRIRQVAGTYGLDVEPERPVHTLSVGERQRVEIVRALLTDPKLLILDEPTSVLTPQAVDKLFITLRQLANQGCSILYISHKLDEIRTLCHHCTVLRGGGATSSAWRCRTFRWTCGPARSWAWRACLATASRSWWPHCRAKTCAPCPAASACSATTCRRPRRAAAASWACTSCRKSGWAAARCPR